MIRRDTMSKVKLDKPWRPEEPCAPRDWEARNQCTRKLGSIEIDYFGPLSSILEAIDSFKSELVDGEILEYERDVDSYDDAIESVSLEICAINELQIPAAKVLIEKEYAIKLLKYDADLVQYRLDLRDYEIQQARKLLAELEERTNDE
jgi:hypothetical protein